MRRQLITGKSLSGERRPCQEQMCFLTAAPSDTMPLAGFPVAQVSRGSTQDPSACTNQPPLPMPRRAGQQRAYPIRPNALPS